MLEGLNLEFKYTRTSFCLHLIYCIVYMIYMNAVEMNTTANNNVLSFYFEIHNTYTKHQYRNKKMRINKLCG